MPQINEMSWLTGAFFIFLSAFICVTVYTATFSSSYRDSTARNFSEISDFCLYWDISIL